MNVEPCAYERVAAVEFRNLNADIEEVRDRVERLEAVLSRGINLLIANLVGVVLMLAQQVMG
jgi:hypothetical protein